ncbi:hypothetical protein MD535_25290 [Vibrio sp. ZSDZ65]|uniref:Uncharacterized protein n=1 Tax=Vibrio qingdaonensis TaxID=2829491 RepID=A0A9X3CTN3_9VIBR|nr:hypothetical protein [Vibrio qingdaonensis]MCW8349300.1 hypothetical protein [Vibrio qingdaonensis]
MIEKRNKRIFFRLLTHAKKFIELREWLNDRVTLDAYQDPQNSIMQVNDTTLSVASPLHSLRFVYIAPFVLAFWGLSFHMIGWLIPNQGMIERAYNMIELNQEYKDLGREYDEKRDMYYRTLVGKDGKRSILNNIKAIHLYGRDYNRHSIYKKIGVICVLLMISLAGTIAFLRLPRMADIYFDRERKIVYTWRKGQIAACNFDNLGYRESSYGLCLLLFSEHKKKQFWPMRFGLQPTGRAHFNNENDNTEFMAQVFAFMDKGKSAVITGESFKRPQPKYYLYIDEKPENFESRLEEILKRDEVLPELYAKHLL